MIGLGGAAVGCLMFYPAAAVRSYNLFLLALFVLASGITLLQVAANPFVAVLGQAGDRLVAPDADAGVQLAGDDHRASVRLAVDPRRRRPSRPREIAQMSPTAADAYRLAEASSVQRPYIGLAATLVAAGGRHRDVQAPEDRRRHAGPRRPAAPRDRKSAWSYRHLVLGRGRDLRLRRRRGGDRQLPRQLLQGAVRSAA